MILTFLADAVLASAALLGLFYATGRKQVRVSAHDQLITTRERLRSELLELEAQAADRIIDTATAEEERRRLQHELAACLAALENTERAKKSATPRRLGFIVFLSLGSVVIALTAVSYVLSHPFPLPEIFDAKQERVPPEVLKMVARLEQRLAQQPNDAPGWAMLGRSYAVLSRDEEAAVAFARAYALAPEDARVLGPYAVWLYQRNPSDPDKETVRIFRKLYKSDPKNASALWVLGLADFNAARYNESIIYWRRMLQYVPQDSAANKQIQTPI